MRYAGLRVSFRNGPSQVPQLQRIYERSPQTTSVQELLNIHCDRLEGPPAPKEKPGAA